MARKLKGKSSSKGLKGALLRHQEIEKKNIKLKKRQQHELAKGKPTKQPERQRELQKERGSGFIPFKNDSSVLLVGEGDFSFAKSIIEEGYVAPEKLVVTSYDSGVKELQLKYPNSFDENYNFLKENNVTVLFGVDATNLIKTMKITKKTPWHKVAGSQWASTKLEFIVFNFPHTGRGIKDQDRNIFEHQQLMHKYFASCKQLFQLVNNNQQGKASTESMGGYLTNSDANVDDKGFGKVCLSLFTGEPYDSWQIKILAKDNGWKVQESGKFDWNKFPAYRHRRTNNEMTTTKPAEQRDARMYVFEMFNKRKHSKKPLKGDDSDSD